MFNQLQDLEWGFVARGTLVAFATLTLGPAALLTLVLLAFVMSPAAIIGLPFILPALFPGANREHAEGVRRASYLPLPHPALAH